MLSATYIRIHTDETGWVFGGHEEQVSHVNQVNRSLRQWEPLALGNDPGPRYMGRDVFLVEVLGTLPPLYQYFTCFVFRDSTGATSQLGIE